MEFLRGTLANEVDHARGIARPVDQARGALQHFDAVIDDRVRDAVVIADVATVAGQAGKAVELEIRQLKAARVKTVALGVVLADRNTRRLLQCLRHVHDPLVVHLLACDNAD
ncbi:hypothetical protein D3C85_486000 [compost metagenome]